MFALYASQSISQLILKYVETLSVTPFLIAGMLSAAAIFPLSITRSVSPEVEEPTVTNVFKIFKVSLLGSLGCLLSGLILSAMYSFTPNFAQEYNIPVSYIMSISIAGGFILQWPIGKLSDAFDRRKILTLIALLSIFPSLAIMFFSGNEHLVIACSFILGGLIFTIYPLGIAQVCDHIEEKNINSAIGLSSLIYGVGAIIGPLIAPIVMNYFGVASLYLYIALVAFSLFLIGLHSIGHRPSISKEEQANYVTVLPRVTPNMSQLDPRSSPDHKQL